MNRCERCQEAEKAIGRAEVRAAEAEAKAGREQRWWLGWMMVTVMIAGYAIYVQQAYALKLWVWYDLIVPARSARQQADQGAPQQRYAPPAQGAPQRLPSNQIKPQQVLPQRRRPAQR